MKNISASFASLNTSRDQCECIEVRKIGGTDRKESVTCWKQWNAQTRQWF